MACNERICRPEKPAPRRQHWLGGLFFLLMFVQEAFARPLVVLSDDTATYETVLDASSSAAGEPLDTVTAEALEQSPSLLYAHPREYLITVGARATGLILDTLPADGPPVIATFIPRRSYEELVEAHLRSKGEQAAQVSAIYLDQPYERQMQLARLILPEAHTLSVAFSEESVSDLPLIEAASREAGFKLTHAVLEEKESPIRQLQPLIETSDIFLTLPDKAVFNRTTAKWILYISYRQRVPLLGFSKKYVDAGAAAGVYSTPEQVGRQTGELLKALLAGQTQLPPPSYPRYFTVSANPSAARSLRLPHLDATRLEQKLKEVER